VGQARGFDESYQACYGRLLRQVALVTADLADAEDMLQEAFARAAIRWRQLETDDAPEAWVLRVAMNLAADTTRRLRRRAAAMLRLGPPPTQPELSADSVDLIPSVSCVAAWATPSDRAAPPGGSFGGRGQSPAWRPIRDRQGAPGSWTHRPRPPARHRFLPSSRETLVDE
jgi:DNA-directed RNA polymerase specialized sigma24 family protein